ncbi:unnamed protein product, partial [Urochloa humidicola]
PLILLLCLIHSFHTAAHRRDDSAVRYCCSPPLLGASQALLLAVRAARCFPTSRTLLCRLSHLFLCSARWPRSPKTFPPAKDGVAASSDDGASARAFSSPNLAEWHRTHAAHMGPWHPAPETVSGPSCSPPSSRAHRWGHPRLWLLVVAKLRLHHSLTFHLFVNMRNLLTSSAFRTRPTCSPYTHSPPRWVPSLILCLCGS